MSNHLSCGPDGGSAGGNATGPSPAVAPGVEGIDPRAVARRIGKEGVDPRVRAVVPGFDAPFFQAGLAGYSDAAMRIVARRQGCPFCVTEALLDRLLLAGGRGFEKADLEALRANVPGGEEDHPLAGQIIGSDPDEMASAALKMIEQARRAPKDYRYLAYGSRSHAHVADASGVVRNGRTLGQVRAGVVADAAERTFDVLDVNLACPVKKIKNKARGGHWLSDPAGAIDILRAVRDAVPAEIPTSVKMRRGSDDSARAERNFHEVFNAAYEIGYSWVTVHGRTVEQKYVGPSRWTFLRDLCAQHPDKVVFGSGDVWEAEDIFRMIGYTGVSGVSVARGCIGDPWIFRRARQLMAGEEPTPPSVAEQRGVLREHFDLAVAVNGERQAGRLMRKFAIKFAQHHPRGAEVKSEFVRVSTCEQWGAVLEKWYGDADGSCGVPWSERSEGHDDQSAL